MATATLAVEDRFLGPAFPIGPDPISAFGPKDSIFVIWTSIVIILTTPKRTVRWATKRGSLVPYLVFDANNEITQSLIRHYTFKDLSEQENRIRVVSVNTIQTGEHSIDIVVVFSVVGDPTARVYNGAVSFNLAA